MTPLFSLPESQTVAPEELTRRREPERRRRRDPPESTVPGDQIGTVLENKTAERKEPGVAAGMKETEKAELGEYHEWFRSEEA